MSCSKDKDLIFKVDNTGHRFVFQGFWDHHFNAFIKKIRPEARSNVEIYDAGQFRIDINCYYRHRKIAPSFSLHAPKELQPKTEIIIIPVSFSHHEEGKLPDTELAREFTGLWYDHLAILLVNLNTGQMFYFCNTSQFPGFNMFTTSVRVRVRSYLMKKLNIYLTYKWLRIGTKNVGDLMANSCTVLAAVILRKLVRHPENPYEICALPSKKELVDMRNFVLELVLPNWKYFVDRL